MRKLFRSCFLFAMPRPLFGVARTLDLGAQFDWYNYSANEAEADSHALYMDWLTVADDLASACAQFDDETRKSALTLHRTETRPRARA